MGKIRTRFIGDEEVEKKQKHEQKERAARKKEEEEKVEGDTPEVAEVEVAPKKEMKKKGSKVAKKSRGKKYTEARKKIHDDKVYELDEAVTLLKKIAYAKFPESVELHLNLLADGVKGEVELPFSTGKTVRVAIVDEVLLEKLEKGVIDFDILITHPQFMPKLAKFARTLGPKGLMPNPKAGTVSPNPEEVAKKFAKGTLRFKAEPKAPLMHQMVAKLTSDEKEIAANVVAFIKAVGLKNIKAAFIKSTMSPALQINLEPMV